MDNDYLSVPYRLIDDKPEGDMDRYFSSEHTYLSQAFDY
jgi:hypothetical protein